MSTAPSFSGRAFPCGVGVRVVISSFSGEADRGGELQGLAVIMSSRQAACSSGDVGSIVMRSGGEAGSAVRGEAGGELTSAGSPVVAHAATRSAAATAGAANEYHGR